MCRFDSSAPTEDLTCAGLCGASHSLNSSWSSPSHAQYLAAGNSPVTVPMEGQTVSLAFGYPDAPGIVLAIQDTTGFTAATVGSTVTFTKTGAATPASCIATYTASTAANTAPVIEVAGVTVDTAGC